MVQIGAGLSGFALTALFIWLPIWRMAEVNTADGLFKYFVVVLMLLFGVFMVSGGRNAFSFMRFVPAFLAGGAASIGFASQMWWLFFAGVVVFAIFYVMMGE